MDAEAAPLAPFASEDAATLRRRRRMEEWRRRSRLIRRLRKVLPAAAVSILVLLFGWIGVRGLIIRFSDLHGAGAGVIHMTNARFYGRDGQGKAYILGAAEATRDDLDPHRIWLRGPILAVNAGDPHESHISADHGVYRDDTRILLLHDHVSVRDPSGDLVTTNQAIVDTAHGSVVGQGAVYGAGPMGTLTAQSFNVYDQGQRVVFRGEVHSVIKRG
ncbi:MAG: LPS export ABC transporter periplasmic protein LptC [Caulobacteraceae bacterium]|nr:LPS export ABC transporter periplasmic protein LptC [Caulobacteraceae bacterium]